MHPVAAFGRYRARRFEITPQDVFHHGGRRLPRFFERFARQKAHQLTVLVGRAPLDGPVARVVGPRRHLVEPESVAFDKEFHGQDARVAARPHERLARGTHACRQLR